MNPITDDDVLHAHNHDVLDALRCRVKQDGVPSGEGYYHCSSCNEVKLESEITVLRECSKEDCGERFDGNENGRNCPECNNPFSRKVADQACPDCLEEDTVEEIAQDLVEHVVAPPPTDQRNKEFSLHPVAELFPEMAADEFEKLVADIKKNGVRLPILVHEGRIVDGRHRYQACKRLGIPCPTQELDAASPWLVAQSLNLVRRHLDPGRVAAIRALAAKKYPEIAAADENLRVAARKRQRSGKSAGGKAGGRGRKKTSPPRGGKVSKSAATTTAAATSVGISTRTMERAERVARQDEQLAEQVTKGEMTLAAAEREVRASSTKKTKPSPEPAPYTEHLTFTVKIDAVGTAVSRVQLGDKIRLEIEDVLKGYLDDSINVAGSPFKVRLVDVVVARITTERKT